MTKIHIVDKQSESGPNISDIDKILASAMDKYLQANAAGSAGQFCHKTEDVRNRISLYDW